MLPRRALQSAVCVSICLAGAVPLAPALAAWPVFQPIGPYGGRVDGFAQAPSAPDRMYCIQGDVFRSDDRGETWYRCPGSPGPARRVAVSPVDEDVLLVSTGSAIQRSTDGGLSFIAAPIVPISTSSALAFDPHDADVVLCADHYSGSLGIHRSTDGGLTWAPSNTGLPSSGGVTSAFVFALAFDPSTPGVVLAALRDYVGPASGLFRSTDSGLTWERRPGPGDDGAWSISWCAGTPSRVWACGFSPGPILRSDDGGLTFLPAGTVPCSGCYLTEIAANPADPDIAVIYVAQDDGYTIGTVGVRRTTDAGATWSWATWNAGHASRDNPYPIVFTYDVDDPSKFYLALSNYGGESVEEGLIRSTDAGASWAGAMNGLAGLHVRALDRDNEGTVYVRRDGAGGIWRSAPLPATSWIRTAGQGRPGSHVPGGFEACRRVPGLLKEVGQWGDSDVTVPNYFRSTDAGDTWVWTNVLWFYLDYIERELVVTNHGSGAVTYLWLGGSSWELFRSDGGAFNTILPTFPTAAAVVDPTDDYRLFAAHASSGEVELSTDGGETWTLRAAGLPADSTVALFMDPDAPERLAVVYQNEGVWRSEDAGVSWTPVPVGGPLAGVVAADWDVASDRFALVTRQNGVRVTGWVPFMGGVTAALPEAALTSVLWDVAHDRLLVGTAGASVYALDLSGATATPEVVSAAKSEPGLRVLGNPARGMVDVELSLPTGAGAAVLDVHGVDGRRVRSFPVAGAGGHAIQWDGRDEAGRSVATGIYFARVRAAGRSAVCRFVLLRE